MDSEFVHRFEAGEAPSAPTLLLLHGTGGDENDLLAVGRSIAPRANLLSPRGRVSEHGMPRFFRRFAEGVFDEDDIRRRAAELGEFIAIASVEYGFDAQQVLAFGYSNGANIACAMLLLDPRPLAGAILLRPMIPLVPQALPDLQGKNILIQAGASDPMGSPAEIEKLVTLLESAGAELTIQRHPGGHGLTHDDFSESQRWLAQHFSKTQ